MSKKAVAITFGAAAVVAAGIYASGVFGPESAPVKTPDQCMADLTNAPLTFNKAPNATSVIQMVPDQATRERQETFKKCLDTYAESQSGFRITFGRQP